MRRLSRCAASSVISGGYRVQRLIENKVLLPGPSLLKRLITTVRDQATQQLRTDLAALPDEEQRHHLNGLLTIEETTSTSRRERLRRGPTSVTAAGLLGVLDFERVRQLGVDGPDLSAVPPGRVATHSPGTSK